MSVPGLGAEAVTIAAEELPSFEEQSASDVLAWALGEFHPNIAISASFQAESMVIIDLATKIQPDVRIFTLDTGRLPQETHELIDQVRHRYDIKIDVIVPDNSRVQAMVRQHGMNLFTRHQTLRMLCCHIRKVEPLRRALTGLDGWITGLRRDQGGERTDVAKVAVDETHGGIVKVNPVADWTRDQVWEYIRANKLPYNELYNRGYTSIGCDPCTRAIQPGEEERAGRWWWEDSGLKECGLHEQMPHERFDQELEWIDEATKP
jgi:thioredoxin-dependent adenylylsulfate APS reductase